MGLWFLLAFACGYTFYRLQLLEKPRLNAFLDRRGMTLALAVVWVLMLAPGLLLLASGPAAHATDTKRGAAAHAGFPLPWAAQGPLPHVDRNWVRDTEGGWYRSVSESAAIVPAALVIDAVAMTLGALSTVSLSRRAVARARRRRGDLAMLQRLRVRLADPRRHHLYVRGIRFTALLVALLGFAYALRLLASLAGSSSGGASLL